MKSQCARWLCSRMPRMRSTSRLRVNTSKTWRTRSRPIARSWTSRRRPATSRSLRNDIPPRRLRPRVDIPEPAATQVCVAIVTELEAFRQSREDLRIPATNDNVLRDERALEHLDHVHHFLL